MNNDDKHLLNYMKNSPRFRQGINKKRWFMLDEKENIIGLMWFKYALEGWRLYLHTDKDNEWVGRGAIKTIHQLETYFK